MAPDKKFLIFIAYFQKYVSYTLYMQIWKNELFSDIINILPVRTQILFYIAWMLS